MRQKGTEKDRIVGKNVIEGRRTDGNRRRQTETDGDRWRQTETDGDGRRRTETDGDGRRRTENVREQNLRNNYLVRNMHLIEVQLSPGNFPPSDCKLNMIKLPYLDY